MKGYVVAYKPEMKVKEYELYNSYYCGVCKSIGKRYGNLPRMVLSYDSVFLAIVISLFDNKAEEIVNEHCIVHPVKKKSICVNSDAVDYAADIMIILAYHKLVDDINDDNSLAAKTLEMLFRRVYGKLENGYPEVCGIIKRELEKLRTLEKEKSSSIDLTTDCFGRIMEAAFSGYSCFGDGKSVFTESHKIVLKVLGFNLGKWIYLADALDDLEENIEKRTYNPLIYRFEFDSKKESTDEFRNRITESMEFLLFHYLGEMGKAFDLMEMKKNSNIVANIIYMGLHRKTEDVLKKGKQ